MSARHAHHGYSGQSELIVTETRYEKPAMCDRNVAASPHGIQQLALEDLPQGRRRVERKRDHLAQARINDEVPGVPLFTPFPNRAAAYAVHPPPQDGIFYADAKYGPIAYSIVLSGGYEDDEDNGDTIVYTGQGGREKDDGEDRQVQDQEWERGNDALRNNVEQRLPVRLIRGPYKKTKSKWSHPTCYRYDGLYMVERAYPEIGKRGYMMCKFDLERVSGQEPLPVYTDYDENGRLRRTANRGQRPQGGLEETRMNQTKTEPTYGAGAYKPVDVVSGSGSHRGARPSSSKQEDIPSQPSNSLPRSQPIPSSPTRVKREREYGSKTRPGVARTAQNTLGFAFGPPEPKYADLEFKKRKEM